MLILINCWSCFLNSYEIRGVFAIATEMLFRFTCLTHKLMPTVFAFSSANLIYPLAGAFKLLLDVLFWRAYR